MNKKIKKYIICVFFISIFIILLYISINEKNINIFSKSYDVYATSKNDEDKTKSSSVSTDKPNSGNDMTDLLARLINGEARGEPYEGQVAVGAVILNRVKSPKFPNTISGVIYQNNQFSCIKDGQFSQPLEKGSTVRKAAEEAINGADPTNGALYFFNPSKTSNKWLFSLKVSATIGKHIFARSDEK